MNTLDQVSPASGWMLPGLMQESVACIMEQLAPDIVSISLSWLGLVPEAHWVSSSARCLSTAPTCKGQKSLQQLSSWKNHEGILQV